MMKKNLIVVFGALAVPLSALAQQPPAIYTLTTHPIKGGAYWVEGGRSNTGFIVGDKGVVVIDAQITQDAVQKELAEIARITPKPVDEIVLTHGDPDHVGGLPYYPAGATIIAHENTRAQIIATAADHSGAPGGIAMYQKLLGYLPTRTIGATETMTLDGVKMTLMYVAPAHSSGDLIIYLPRQRIVYTGDIVTTNGGRFPAVHYATGGSSAGWIASMKALLALKADTYIPGHGAIETRAQLQARLHDVEQRREQIKAMVMAGKNYEEVQQALPEPGSNPMFPTFDRTTYDELTQGYPAARPPWANLVKH